MSSNSNYKNKWSMYEFFRLGFSFVLTKLFYRKAKLISYPVYIRGKKNMRYGEGLNLGYGNHFDLINNSKVTLNIGKNCEFGDYCHIVAIESVTIGDNFMCASRVLITDCNHGNYSNSSDEILLTPRERSLSAKPVKIGNNVWIGEGCSILAGVVIGDGAVVGANSVVTHDVEPYTIVAGVPAVPIKQFDVEKKQWINLRSEAQK